jgi:hypothetical protein
MGNDSGGKASCSLGDSVIPFLQTNLTEFTSSLSRGAWFYFLLLFFFFFFFDYRARGSLELLIPLPQHLS